MQCLDDSNLGVLFVGSDAVHHDHPCFVNVTLGYVFVKAGAGIEASPLHRVECLLDKTFRLLLVSEAQTFVLQLPYNAKNHGDPLQAH